MSSFTLYSFFLTCLINSIIHEYSCKVFYIFNFSLKGQEGEWKKHVKDNDCNELLLANCIAASAFLTYCGPFNMDTRKRMGEFFMQVCEHHGLPLAKKSLFRNQQLVEFLYKPVSVNQLKKLTGYMGPDARKPVFGGLRTTKPQTSLCIRAV